MSSVLWFVVAVAACALLFYVAYAIEPHWVAKDGSRFVTTSETIDHEGKVVSKRHEVRGTIMSDGLIMLGKRSMLRTRSSLWRISAKAPEVRRGRQQYILDTVPADPFGEKLILRVPRSSRLVPRLDAILTGELPPPT
jgi:hypothetical protein